MHKNSIESKIIATSKSTGIDLIELNQKGKCRQRQERSASLYPKNEDLPWHFSWLSAGNLSQKNGFDEEIMIGGSSLPCERVNYPAMIKVLF